MPTVVTNGRNAIVLLLKQSNKNDDEGKAPVRNVGDSLPVDKA
jgi:hypothetical protein